MTNRSHPQMKSCRHQTQNSLQWRSASPPAPSRRYGRTAVWLAGLALVGCCTLRTAQAQDTKGSVAPLATPRLASLQRPDAKEILAKTKAIYKDVKSIQVDVEVVSLEKNKIDYKIRTSVKQVIDKTGDIRVRVFTTSVTNGSHPPNRGLGQANDQYVNDGKHSYMYWADKNQYERVDRSLKARSTVMDVLDLMTEHLDLNYKLVGDAKVDGVPTYLLEASPTDQEITKSELYIDQKTYHIRQIRVTKKAGADFTSTTTIHNELLNASIPDSIFVFVPPRGAKDATPPEGPPKEPGRP